MQEAHVSVLQNGSEQEACNVLNDFTTRNAQVFSFPDLSPDLKTKIVEALIHRLNAPGSSKCHVLCLKTLRMFSREKDKLVNMVSEPTIATIMRMTGLNHYASKEGDLVEIQNGDPEVMLEALKCLCNLVFNSQLAQRICSKNGCVEGIIQRLKTYKDPALPHEIKFFDMRLLSLLTALCEETSYNPSLDLHKQGVFPFCTHLEEEAHFMRLVCVLKELLLCKTKSKDLKEELQSMTVNLLTNVPLDCYEELLTPLNEDDDDIGLENKEAEYDGKNMEAILVLLDFLYHRLDKPSKMTKDSLAPILCSLCQMCKANRTIRKFCRLKVLPPLKEDVKRLPEEGKTLRNKLCKILTSASEIKDMVAEFLFILCKESVARMVKYTGYGNAAGLLANRGMLMGGRKCDGDYSSGSEESDTEEYARLRDQVNPITGRWEEDKVNPMEEMSEEQKEYEAMRLVNDLDKLQRQGIIQPCRVGDDGKPEPVEHILQLTENIKLKKEDKN
ncbi:synembryn-A-like [Saccostrea cucullata]|uniref:synembryn-A-like n=1 Tax=Saccostrea cuccullata TaxID=36930 RepID=UPI002ED1056E